MTNPWLDLDATKSPFVLDIDEAAVVEAVAHNVVVYESLPYHSRELGSVTTPIPSQSYTDALARQAVTGARIVIWQRATRWRDLLSSEKQWDQAVVKPRSSQSSYLSRGNLGEENFARVVEAITA